jgi:Family of unknown function (DUF6232)
MAVNSDASAAGQHGGFVYYRGPRIVVTNHYIENAHGRYPVRDLRLIERVHVLAHPARTVAMICGVIELALAAPLAAAYGSLILLCAGFITAFGLAAAILVDGRRNPRWMALRGIHRGRAITLFGSRNRKEFEQVRRAVIRAVEANRAPRP